MKLSIEMEQLFAPGRPGGMLRTRRLAVAGLAAWAALSSLEPAVAAPPAAHRQVWHAQHAHAPQMSPAAPQGLPFGAPTALPGPISVDGRVSLDEPVSMGLAAPTGCATCGKKRRSVVRRLLDGFTAGTDWLIFGSPYRDSCDCDSGCDAAPDSACDAMELTPHATGLTPFGGGVPLAPTPTSPGVELLPAPIHHPPMPPSHAPGATGDSAGTPRATLHRASPGQSSSQAPRSSSRAPHEKHSPRDLSVDPFGDDPVSPGSTPTISRSAYYE